MRIYKSGNAELAARLGHLGLLGSCGAPRDAFLQFRVFFRRRHRGDLRALNKNITLRRVIYIAVMIIDAGSANKQ